MLQAYMLPTPMATNNTQKRRTYAPENEGHPQDQCLVPPTANERDDHTLRGINTDTTDGFLGKSPRGGAPVHHETMVGREAHSRTANVKVTVNSGPVICPNSCVVTNFGGSGTNNRHSSRGWDLGGRGYWMSSTTKH